MSDRARRLATALAGAILVAGCRSLPGSGTTLQAQEVAGLGFTHRLLVAGEVRGDGPRFVFFEGDGRPWSSDGLQAATNPDPLRAVAPGLAAAQGDGAIVLGRPCYHGRAADPGCEPGLWTSARYSEAIVASMATALERTLEASPPRPVVLVGVSGGGALALLVAERSPRVRAVVTLGANIDVDGWAKLHGYRPLEGSLDPLVTRPAAPGCEIHIAAGRDTVVPAPLIRAAAARRQGAVFWIEDDADHGCCWQTLWPAIADRVAAQLASAGCFTAG
jgi:pimeloyl-ACP methyl ester carboxylesterase